jgi:hypothetical protein
MSINYGLIFGAGWLIKLISYVHCNGLLDILTTLYFAFLRIGNTNDVIFQIYRLMYCYSFNSRQALSSDDESCVVKVTTHLHLTPKLNTG